MGNIRRSLMLDLIWLIMVNVFRFSAALFAIFTCAVVSGCSDLKQLSHTSPFGQYISALSQDGPDSQETSAWYYESLALCQTTPEIIQSYQLPKHQDLWERIRYGYQLYQPSNPRIEQELNWYSKHPSYLPRVTKRGAPYLYYIVEELYKRNMPMELALLPIVESAFDPFAYSHGQASGMWQVVPGTGTMLGLKQNWWYDGRRDIIASTDAALDYLQKLNKQFDGDWMLALAAYNSGAGNVRKAIRKNTAAGKPTDYWSLHLPAETESYVPKLLALSTLIKDPNAFEIVLHPAPNEPYFRQVNTGSQIDLAHAAELAEMSMDEFYVLNPAFNRWATDPKGPYQILIPEVKADKFEQQLSAIPKDQRVTWDRYKIKPGDTLSTIAKRYNTTSDALRSINDIVGNDIRAGKVLLVPIASANATHYAYSLAQRIKKKQSRGNGHKLDYIVQSGDSLWTISRRYKTTPNSLANWNGMAPADTLRPGQKLVIWSKTAKSSNANSGVVRKLAYKVKKGDSLALIADKFSVKIKDIKMWNQVNAKKYLQPGDFLTLFVDVKRMN